MSGRSIESRGPLAQDDEIGGGLKAGRSGLGRPATGSDRQDLANDVAVNAREATVSARVPIGQALGKKLEVPELGP